MSCEWRRNASHTTGPRLGGLVSIPCVEQRGELSDERPLFVKENSTAIKDQVSIFIAQL